MQNIIAQNAQRKIFLVISVSIAIKQIIFATLLIRGSYFNDCFV